jgi:hypothetical protein
MPGLHEGSMARAVPRNAFDDCEPQSNQVAFIDAFQVYY